MLESNCYTKQTQAKLITVHTWVYKNENVNSVYGEKCTTYNAGQLTAIQRHYSFGRVHRVHREIEKSAWKRNVKHFCSVEIFYKVIVINVKML